MTVTTLMLKNITSLLIDIHGQHEHQHILQTKYHLDIIDSFIKDKSIFSSYENKLTELKNINFEYINYKPILKNTPANI